jgi:hypothetical protein
MIYLRTRINKSVPDGPLVISTKTTAERIWSCIHVSTYYHSSCLGSMLLGAYVAPTSEVPASTILLLLTVGTWRRIVPDTHQRLCLISQNWIIGTVMGRWTQQSAWWYHKPSSQETKSKPQINKFNLHLYQSQLHNEHTCSLQYCFTCSWMNSKKRL